MSQYVLNTFNQYILDVFKYIPGVFSYLFRMNFFGQESLSDLLEKYKNIKRYKKNIHPMGWDATLGIYIMQHNNGHTSRNPNQLEYW